MSLPNLNHSNTAAEEGYWPENNWVWIQTPTSIF